MSKFLFIPLFFLVSVSLAFGQKQMEISVYDLGQAVPREAGDNETVVIVKSPLQLSFESTMDKVVDMYDTKEESGFNLYYLRFSTLPKYKGRKLKVKCNMFETQTYLLELTAKVPMGLYVVDPNGTVGVGCYHEHRNKGNEYYEECNYAEAKVEYFQALECSNIPDENDLSKKIEDADNCAVYKRDADNLYNTNKWEQAKREYEKVAGLNLKDEYSQKRIDLCNEKIGDIPRIIRGKITDQSGVALEGVTIKAEYIKLDKKGKVRIDKNGIPEKEYKTVGKTEADGRYSITVLNKSKYLEFTKGNFLSEVKYGAVVEIVSDEMDISLQSKVTLGGITDGVSKGLGAVEEVSNTLK